MTSEANTDNDLLMAERAAQAERERLLPHALPTAETISARDALLRKLRSAFADEIAEEEVGYGIGFDEGKQANPFSRESGESIARAVTELGTSTNPRVNFAYAGNSRVDIPVHPPRPDRITAAEMPIQCAVNVSEGRFKEVDTMSRLAPRPATTGDPLTIFTAVNRPSAGAVTHANVLGILVQLFGVQNALQAGFRASTLPFVPYNVVYARIADRQLFLDDPYYVAYAELTGVRLPQDQLDVLQAMFSPGGASNFVWTQAADPDAPEESDNMHTIGRNVLPGASLTHQIYYFDTVVGRRGTVGGRVFTLPAVEGLIGSISKDLPRLDVEQAMMEASAYIHVYAAPEPDGRADREEHRGAKLRDQHAEGPLGPTDLLLPPEPAARRAGANFNEMPHYDGGVIVHPNVPRTAAPDLRNDGANFRHGVQQAIPRLRDWNADNMRFHTVINDGQAVMVRIRVLGGVAPPEFFVYVEGTVWERPFSLQELVDLGLALTLAQAWFDRWQAEWIDYAQPAPPDNEPEGPYSAYRSIFCGVDAETVYLFPTYDPLHVLGLLAGFYVVPGREQRVDILPARNAYVASQLAATTLSWFYQRALYVRKLDGNVFAYSEYAAHHLMFSVPYAYRVVTSPREHTRLQYPWGNNQAMDPMPAFAAGNKSSYIGYDIEGVVALDSPGVISVGDTAGKGLAKLDAWARAVWAATGVLVSPDAFAIEPRFIYTDAGVAGTVIRFVHPFGLPFKVNRRERQLRANLFELGPTEQKARYYSRGVLPFDPSGPVPLHVSREIR